MNSQAARLALAVLLVAGLVPASRVAADGAGRRAIEATGTVGKANALYDEIGLDGTLDRDAFVAAYERAQESDLASGVLAIADLSLPSTERRLAVIDLRTKALVLHTWVAHGQNSGGLNADRFSNRRDSHQTSLGLYRVGAEIVSPKHGPALLLHGLDAGLNDQALAREIIIHGAEYVSEAFIAANGRLGRSWGCPAVPRATMRQMIALLANGGALYIHGG